MSEIKALDMLRDSLIGYQAVTGEDMGAFLLHADEIEAEISEARETTRKKHQTERVYWHNELHKILDAINGQERFWGACMDYPLPEATIPPSEVAKRMLSERYMLLPVDANNEPIHVGDVMEYENPNDDDKPFTVLGVNNDGDVFHCLEDKRLVPTCISLANCLHHAKPRTLEDVLQDRINDVLIVMTSGIPISLESTLNDAFGEECVNEIRELMCGDAEEGSRNR